MARRPSYAPGVTVARRTTYGKAQVLQVKMPAEKFLAGGYK